MTEPEFHVRERACHFSVLRVRRPDAVLCAALGREFALAWPTRPNTWADGAASVLWLTPAEWAVLGIPAGECAARALRACGGALHDVADVSDGRVQFELSGRRLRDVMAKGCSLDLHPRAFGAAACAQTLFAQVPVLLAGAATAGAPEMLRVWVDIALAHSLRLWLRDASMEYT